MQVEIFNQIISDIKAAKVSFSGRVYWRVVRSQPIDDGWTISLTPVPHFGAYPICEDSFKLYQDWLDATCHSDPAVSGVPATGLLHSITALIPNDFGDEELRIFDAVVKAAPGFKTLTAWPKSPVSINLHCPG